MSSFQELEELFLLSNEFSVLREEIMPKNTDFSSSLE